RQAFATLVRVTGLEGKVRVGAVGWDHPIEHALLRIDQRGELGQDHLGYGGRVALALQHAGESCKVRLQPVLLGVLFGRLLEVADHFVDVVFENRDLTTRVDPDGPREIALGHRRGDVCDGADLRGQRGGQLVHVVGEVAPRACRAGHACLATELAFYTYLAGHACDLLSKDGEGLGHVVDGL